MLAEEKKKWMRDRIVPAEIEKYLPADGADFVNDAEIFRLLEETGEPAAAQVRDVVAKALAVQTLSQAEVATLLRVRDPGLWDEMRAAAGRPEVVIGLNRQFHKLLLDAARNRFLLRAMATVENTLLILGSSSMAKPDRAREAVDEHREVLDALLARDGAAAEAAMRRHMERAQFARLRILRRANAEDGE